MKSIWKFGLQVKDSQKVNLPLGAKILTAQFQGDQLCLWALVETEMDLCPRSIFIFGTGEEMPDKKLLYIATVQDAPYVWHIFE